MSSAPPLPPLRQPCASFHSFSTAAITSVLSPSRIGAPLSGTASTISELGISPGVPPGSSGKSGHCVPAGRYTSRPSGSVNTWSLLHSVRSTPFSRFGTSGSSSFSQNCGSSVISCGEIVVYMRVRYGCAPSSSAACCPGSTMRCRSFTAKSVPIHPLVSTPPPYVSQFAHSSAAETPSGGVTYSFIKPSSSEFVNVQPLPKS